MSERKRPGRFTIQFSQQDPQQRMATEILERKGRHKAQFITSAILQYDQSASFCVPHQSICGLDEGHLEQIILSVIKKYPHVKASALESSDTRKAPMEEPETLPPLWDDVGDVSALAAITNTLAAFRQK